MDKQALLAMIASKQYKEIKQALESMPPADICLLVEDLHSNNLLLVFRMLPKDLAADVFSRFSAETKENILSSISDEEFKGIVNELFFDDMIDIIEEMPANLVNNILKYATQIERELVNQFLNYPDSSAGSIMTIEYVELRKEMTVGQALEHIKLIGLTRETIYTCYVTNNERVLEGVVSLRTLVTSNLDTVISELMDTDVISVSTSDDQEFVGKLFVKYGFIALPVVDHEHRLTGIITVDDVMDVIEQETTEDFQRMAAMSPSEESYLESSVWYLAKQRLPWLFILMIGGALTGGIIGRYEEILSAFPVLMASIPMLMDTGGNAGSQSSTLIIRGLAIDEITWTDKWKVLWKELEVSIVVSSVLALTNFLKNIYIDKVEIGTAFTISITLVAVVVMSKVVGGILPILAEKMKLDPAMMAGPLITTLVDSIALFIYFGLAKAILGI